MRMRGWSEDCLVTVLISVAIVGLVLGRELADLEAATLGGTGGARVCCGAFLERVGTP